jgi:hypothetical protein
VAFSDQLWKKRLNAVKNATSPHSSRMKEKELESRARKSPACYFLIHTPLYYAALAPSVNRKSDKKRRIYQILSKRHEPAGARAKKTSVERV